MYPNIYNHIHTNKFIKDVRQWPPHLPLHLFFFPWYLVSDDSICLFYICMCEYIVLLYKYSNVCGHMSRCRCRWVNISVKVQFHSPSYVLSERLSPGPELSDSAPLLTYLPKPNSPHVRVKYFTHWTISPGLYVYLNRLLKQHCSSMSHEFWRTRFHFKWYLMFLPIDEALLMFCVEFTFSFEWVLLLRTVLPAHGDPWRVCLFADLVKVSYIQDDVFQTQHPVAIPFWKTQTQK